MYWHMFSNSVILTICPKIEGYFEFSVSDKNTETKNIWFICKCILIFVEGYCALVDYRVILSLTHCVNKCAKCKGSVVQNVQMKELFQYAYYMPAKPLFLLLIRAKPFPISTSTMGCFCVSLRNNAYSKRRQTLQGPAGWPLHMRKG